jgi:hypothetical protein
MTMNRKQLQSKLNAVTSELLKEKGYISEKSYATHFVKKSGVA